MSFGACVLLLLALLVTALDPAVAHATQSRDFAVLVDVGGGRKMYLECRGIGSPARHEIQKEQPQLVVDAIRQVVDAVRGGSRRLVR